MTPNNLLGDCRSMCPAKRKRQKSVGVERGSNTDATNIRWREPDAPKAICQIQSCDAWGVRGFRGRMQGANFKKSGEAKFRWLGRAIGIQGTHVYD